VDFLQAGPPPLYIGFGSMKERQPEKTTTIMLEAVEMSGQRAILSAGWAGLGEGDLPETIYRVESVPHDWLFPKVSAVVHHGGAGTTAAGLRAGRPTITVPFFADQFFWGYQAYHLGAALKPIDHKKLSAPGLAVAIRQAAASPDLHVQAEKIGSLLRDENGAARAVNILTEKIWPKIGSYHEYE
jgi:sterol 3beta-glucosyltransferase